MDYKAQIETIKNQFQNSFNFYILKNNYGFSDVAREYLDEYKSVLNDMWIEDNVKYERLLEIINRNMETTLLTVQTIPSINAMWKPNYSATTIEGMDKRSKTVCESIQNIFENSQVRKNLSNNELYKLYSYYYQLSVMINNNQINDDILMRVEQELKSVVDKVWSNSITNATEFKQGEPFKFIVHNISSDEMNGKRLGNYGRKGRLSCSLITDQEMCLFGAYKYGFVLPYESNIVTSGFKDLDSYESSYGERMCLNRENSSLITPDSLENFTANLSMQNNGQKLVHQKGFNHNEILLDTSKGVNPTAVYCVTNGENELSRDYRQAKQLAEEYGLPLIEIDISLYRTKNNQGSYLTDVEDMTISEQRKFAQEFLIQYCESKNVQEQSLETMVNSYLSLYQDNIIDIFLQVKRSGKEINKDDLFQQFTQLTNSKRDKMINFYANSEEMKKLVESIKNLQEALSSTDNIELQERIKNEIDTLSKRINELNKLMINENSLDLSPENWIYQSNNISNEIMQDFTPFVIEQIKVGDKVIDAITGYKTKEQIEEEKENMLEQVSLSSDPTIERLEHARRVIDVKCNGYIANATISKVNQYELNNPELDRTVESSRTFIDVAHLDRDITNYDELIAIRQELINGINELEDNRRVLNGESAINVLEQFQLESEKKINSLSELIKNSEEQIRELRSQQTQLSFEKQQLEKGFFNKLTSSSKIQELESKMKDIDREIEKLEHTIELSKDDIKFEETFINGQIENFLNNFGSNGMTLEDYKTRLKKIQPNGYELTDLSKQKEMEERLKQIEKKINDMTINVQNEQQMKQALEQKKKEVGIVKPQQLGVEEQNEDELEITTGISR